MNRLGMNSKLLMIGVATGIFGLCLIGCSRAGPDTPNELEAVEKAMLHSLSSRLTLDYESWEPGDRSGLCGRLRQQIMSDAYRPLLKGLAMYATGQLILNPSESSWVKTERMDHGEISLVVSAAPRDPGLGSVRFAVGITFSGDLLSIRRGEEPTWVSAPLPDTVIELVAE